MQMRPNMGRWNEHGEYVRRPLGATETDLEWDLYASYRTPWKRLQVAALVPFVVNARSAQGQSAIGGGIGDLNIGLRLDALETKQLRAFPFGVAILGGITLPTGSSVESSSRPFAVDATGQGSVDAIAGLAMEHAAGSWLFDAIALATIHAPRNAAQQSRAPGILSTGAVTYVLPGGTALGAMLGYGVEWDASIAGVTAKDSARRILRTGVFALHPLGHGFRVTGSVIVDPPIPELGQNELAGISLIAGLQRGFD